MTMVHMIGKGGISAKIIADSVSPLGKRITTFELEYPRFIHSELMTHRLFSRNSSSTRAIPVQRMIELVQENTATPVHWGENNPGMQSNRELDNTRKEAAKGLWFSALGSVVSYAKIMSDKVGINGHKQWVGRILEPFVMMKVVLTATEFNNFWWLRNHADAQPEIKELAVVMKKAFEHSTPVNLKVNQWHMPYVISKIENGNQTFWLNEETQLTLEQALKVSVSCCAQVSYRKLDDTLEKAEKIFSMLHLNDNSGAPSHASPTEHQAFPMNVDTVQEYQGATWEPGVTHIDRNGKLWSGNFQGWIQYRKLIPGEAVW